MSASEIKTTFLLFACAIGLGQVLGRLQVKGLIELNGYCWAGIFTIAVIVIVALELRQQKKDAEKFWRNEP